MHKDDSAAPSDRELLELAAKAAGYKVAWEGGSVTGWMAGGTWWNPLTDDGDALRLLLALKLRLDYLGDQPCIEGVLASGMTVEESARRAIVRAAAGKGEAS